MPGGWIEQSHGLVRSSLLSHNFHRQSETEADSKEGTADAPCASYTLGARGGCFGLAFLNVYRSFFGGFQKTAS